ncbi:hypothetical protein SCLCIDRAFT_966940 [Scleroderma citrinum Foug A]|uniref:Uncharacterized protein n=1 Tax=Scleroderma citrinum Foug A TaxID=1036808 RepID=A0A0C3DWJ3_9AGAM|nr:hypothetical protein SCLCIDRAFT_966940 [Scleroderma citrinum Foug A]
MPEAISSKRRTKGLPKPTREAITQARPDFNSPVTPAAGGKRTREALPDKQSVPSTGGGDRTLKKKILGRNEAQHTTSGRSYTKWAETRLPSQQWASKSDPGSGANPGS